MKNNLFVIAIELRQNAKKEDVEVSLSELGEWATLVPNVYALKSAHITDIAQIRDVIYNRVMNDLRIYVGELNASAWRISLDSSEWLKKNLNIDESEQ